MSKDCFYMGLLPENCPMVVHLKDQAPYHPFGSTEGTIGAGREQCFDTHPIPAIYVCQIDTAIEAGRALSPTATP